MACTDKPGPKLKFTTLVHQFSQLIKSIYSKTQQWIKTVKGTATRKLSPFRSAVLRAALGPASSALFELTGPQDIHMSEDMYSHRPLVWLFTEAHRRRGSKTTLRNEAGELKLLQVLKWNFIRLFDFTFETSSQQLPATVDHGPYNGALHQVVAVIVILPLAAAISTSQLSFLSWATVSQLFPQG